MGLAGCFCSEVCRLRWAALSKLHLPCLPSRKGGRGSSCGAGVGLQNELNHFPVS